MSSLTPCCEYENIILPPFVSRKQTPNVVFLSSNYILYQPSLLKMGVSAKHRHKRFINSQKDAKGFHLVQK